MTATTDAGAPRIAVSEEARPTSEASDGGGWTLLHLALGALVIAVLGAGAFIALSSGTHSTTTRLGDEPPLIRADDRAFKVSPDDPGGLEVPNRDKLVYSRLKGVVDTPEVERLLPGPEQPLPLPEPPATPPAASAPLPSLSPSPSSSGSAAAPELATPLPAPTETPAEPPTQTQPNPPPDSVAEEPAPLSGMTVATIHPVARPATRPAQAKSDAGPAATATLASVEQKPAAGSGRYQVQLGAMSTPELAHAQWTKLMAGNADVLGRLQPSIARADLGEKGVLYRLRAGPIDDVERAQALCKSLSARSVGCIVISAGD